MAGPEQLDLSGEYTAEPSDSAAASADQYIGYSFLFGQSPSELISRAANGEDFEPDEIL